MTPTDDLKPDERGLVTRINRFLQAGERDLGGADTLLRAAAELILELGHDRSAAWLVANAASEGHGTIRSRFYELAQRLEIHEIDNAESIMDKFRRYIEHDTNKWQECLRSSENELDPMRERLKATEAALQRSAADLHQALGLGLYIPDEVTPVAERYSALLEVARTTAATAATADRLEREHGELMEKLAARAESGPADHQREIAELRALAAANAEVLQRQGNALAQLQVVLLMAGAPKSGDLRAWASDVRNTILGQRAEINELVGYQRNNATAREHELREFMAAADSLPAPLKPANGYPYSLMASTPPVSGA